jgi:hypothetical protein
MRMIALAVAMILSGVASAAESRVDLLELAQLSPESLESLRDTEFEVFRAHLMLKAGKQRESEARQSLSTVKRELQIEQLDLKAAKAEHKAAKANTDTQRVSLADAALKNASRDRATAELLIEWKEKELRASRLAVDQSKLGLTLAEARRDLARAHALQSAQAPSAVNYPVAEYQKNAIKAQQAYDAALAKAEKMAAEADQFARKWQKRSGSEPLD